MEPKSNYEIFCHVSDETLSLIVNFLKRHDNDIRYFKDFPCFCLKSSLKSVELGEEIKKNCQLKEGESFMVQGIKAGTTGYATGTVIFYADKDLHYADLEMSYITSLSY